jgi:hypothetical protein
MWSNIQFFGCGQDEITTSIETAQHRIRTVKNDHDIQVATDWKNCIASRQHRHLCIDANQTTEKKESLNEMEWFDERVKRANQSKQVMMPTAVAKRRFRTHLFYSEIEMIIY